MEGGGLIVLLIKSLASLKQLYSMAMDVHARYRTGTNEPTNQRAGARAGVAACLRACLPAGACVRAYGPACLRVCGASLCLSRWRGCLSATD